MSRGLLHARKQGPRLPPKGGGAAHNLSSAKRLSSRTAYIRSAGGSKDQLRVLRYWTTIPPTAATRANTIMNG